MLIKTTFKDSTIAKKIRNYVLKCKFCLNFLILQNGEKIDYNKTQGVCHVVYVFLDVT